MFVKYKNSFANIFVNDFTKCYYFKDYFSFWGRKSTIRTEDVKKNRELISQFPIGKNSILLDFTGFLRISRSISSINLRMLFRVGSRRESLRFRTSRWDCPGVSHRIWHKFFWARLRSCSRSAHRTFHIASGTLLLILGGTCQVQYWDIRVCNSGI